MPVPFSQFYIAGMGTISVPTTSPIQLSTTSVPCVMVQYCAPSTNTGVMVIGISTAAVATTGRLGLIIAAGGPSSGTIYAKDLQDVYIGGNVTTDNISYIYYLNTVP